MKVGIIGSGSMGSGIAQIAAEAGHEVLVYDNNPAALERAKASMTALFEKLVAKERRTQEAAERTLSRITYVNQLLSLNSAGLIIEAIVEDLGVKRAVFEQLSNSVGSDCILATNTSSLSVTAIAASAKTPGQVVGLHFFNPAPLMKLVEVVPAAQTRQEVIPQLAELMKTWGKVPVVAQDTPGFIVNRVARPYYSEAILIYEEGMASPAEIDTSLEKAGFKMGPFYLTDFIGHDVNFAVTESMFHAYWGEPRYKPSFSQKRLVDAGYLGRKAKKGFYSFDESLKPIRPESTLTKDREDAIVNRILAVLINEAADALHFNVASEQDIDKAMKLGTNYPKGLLEWAKEIGPQLIIDRLDALYAYYHDGRYRVSPGLRKLANAQS